MKKNVQQLEICIQGGISSNMKILPMKKKMYSSNALFMTGQGIQIDRVSSPERNKNVVFMSATIEEESLLYLNQKMMENVEFFIHNDNYEDMSLTIHRLPFKKLSIRGFRELELKDISTEEISFGKKVRKLLMDHVDYKRFD